VKQQQHDDVREAGSLGWGSRSSNAAAQIGGALPPDPPALVLVRFQLLDRGSACRELVAAAELQSLQRVGCSAELQSLQRVGCSSRVQATRVGVETAHLGLARRGRQGRRNNASSGLGRRLHSWMGHRAMGAMLIQQDRLT
jgi:hypothetical protein